MTHNHWPDDIPSPHQYAFMCFSPDIAKAIIMMRFEDRYGRPPAYIVDAYGCRYAGPVPGPKEGDERWRQIGLGLGGC